MTDKLRDAAHQVEREAFEAKWATPTNCTWTGNGYCSTEYHAWSAESHALRWEGWKARAELAQQDAQAAPDIGELYAQGWINGGQVQSLIDWCNSGCAKRVDIAFAGGSTRQMAYAIEHLVKRASNTETSEGVFVPRELLAKVANALGLPYEAEHTRLRSKLLDILSFAAPAQQDAQAVQSGTCKQNLQVEKLLDDMLDLLPYNSPDYWIERIKEVRYVKHDDHLEDHLDMVGQQQDAQEKQS